ncbi:hypothetical protein AmDm5_2200 [Acetobacter malorum]|nr:hypothetical protein AmDm5_2200 [Acetobacter malorum]
MRERLLKPARTVKFLPALSVFMNSACPEIIRAGAVFL